MLFQQGEHAQEGLSGLGRGRQSGQLCKKLLLLCSGLVDCCSEVVFLIGGVVAGVVGCCLLSGQHQTLGLSEDSLGILPRSLGDFHGLLSGCGPEIEGRSVASLRGCFRLPAGVA